MGDATTRPRLPEPGLERIADALAGYTPAERRAAAVAIEKLRSELQGTILYQAPGTFWQDVRQVGAFTLWFLASPDFFDVIEIAKDDGRLPERASLCLVRGGRIHAYPLPGPHAHHRRRLDRRRAALLQRLTGLPVVDARAAHPFGVGALLRFARASRATAPEGCWRATGLRRLLLLLAEDRVVVLTPEAASLFEDDDKADVPRGRLSADDLRRLVASPAFHWRSGSKVSNAPSTRRNRPPSGVSGGAASAANDGEAIVTDNLVSVAEMRKELGHILNRAHYGDEVVTVAKRERPFVAIISEKESRNLVGVRELADDLEMETATLVDRLHSVDREELRKLLEGV